MNRPPYYTTPLMMLILAAASLLYGCFRSAGSNATGQRPNILIITIDNVGYGDLPPYNEDSPIITPNIDRMANQGARLTRFYTASPTCSASRAALLTGRIPQRNGLDYQLPGIAGNYGIGLRHSELLISELIKESPAGYTTGAFGKWNIGFAPGSRPTERGFDEYFGNASGNIDYFTHVYGGIDDLYHNTESINRKGEYTTDLYADNAIEFIREKSGVSTPWFVYLPFNAPHRPASKNVAPDDPVRRQAPAYAFEPYGLSPDIEDSQQRFNAVVTAADMAIGRVLDTLDSLGIAENTFVFLYSDNGAFSPPVEAGDQSNEPLRGFGTTLWEGGIRVPAFVRWPGQIEANSVVDAPLWSPDLFVAFAELAGAELPQDRFIDGKNPLPVLKGEEEISPHNTMFFQYEEYDALHWGDWKIIRENSDEPWQLYNLRDDISESNNLASERPEVVQKLDRSFSEQLEEIESTNAREQGRL